MKSKSSTSKKRVADDAVKKVTRAVLKKGTRSRILAAFGEYKGKNYLNVRQQTMNNEGEFVFTPAGFNIPDTVEDMEAARKFFSRIVKLIDQHVEDSQ